MFPSSGIISTSYHRAGRDSIYFLGDNAISREPHFYRLLEKFRLCTVVYMASITSIDPTLCTKPLPLIAPTLAATWHVTLPAMRMIIVLNDGAEPGNVLNAGFDQVLTL